MNRKRGCAIFVGSIFFLLLVGALVVWRFASQNVNLATSLSGEGVADVVVPAGFTTTLFATDLNGPRFMTVSPDGVLHVADRRNNRIVALPDDDGDGVADATVVVADDIDAPHSLVFHASSLYVGITSGILKLTDTSGDGIFDSRTTIIDDYPTSGNHSTRTVEFLPDGRMVVSIGSSCNVCDEEDERRAAIVVYDSAEGGGESLYAVGLRNAVGLAVDPFSGALWATNNGRDLMGDDLPPDGLYNVVENGVYGWPRCHNGTIVDPDMGEANSCDGILLTVADIQAHSAPLGLAFYTDDQFPSEYHGGIFMAYHGSWNRTVPTGYKVTFLPLRDGEPAGPIVDFATGWLDSSSGQAVGRPVDVTVGADGALYVSDDKAGLIYRIAFRN